MSYIGNLYSILTNQAIVNDDTLLLNGPTPYDDPPKPGKDYALDDFNTGTRYQKAWKVMKRDRIDYPFGDVLFVDKTAFDSNERLTGEPVMHTNSLIKCEARNQAAAWYSLGSVPPQKNQGHLYASDKLVDYHQCLKFLLSEYMHIQNKMAGILWPISFKGSMYMVRFRPYVLACLGDTPGQNAMTGKVSGTQKLCRYCDIDKDELSNPWATYRLMTVEWQNEIQRTQIARKEKAYYHVDVVWNHINFGGCDRAIHGSCPGEILHVFQKGYHIRNHECMVTVPCLSMKARKEDRRILLENVEELTQEVVTASLNKRNARKARGKANATSAAPKARAVAPKQTATTKTKKSQNKTAREVDKQKDLIKRGVFGGSFGKQVDVIARKIGIQLSRQSDRNICRTHFPKGIMNRCKTTASEQQGLTFLMNIILCSTWANKKDCLRDRLGDVRTGGFIQIMENLLCLEELLKIHPGKHDRTLMKSDIRAVDSYTRAIMYKVTDVADRKTGDGHNLIKFHLLVHMLAEDLERYGLHRNVSGSAGESQFKKKFKLPASTTQKRTLLFDQQVSEHHHQIVTVETCLQRLQRIDELLQSDQGYDESALCRDTNSNETNMSPVVQAATPTQLLTNTHQLCEGSYQIMVTYAAICEGDDESEAFKEDLFIVFKGKSKSQRGKIFSKWCRGNGILSTNKKLQYLGDDGRKATDKGLGNLQFFNSSFSLIFDYLKEMWTVPGYQGDLSPACKSDRRTIFTMLKLYTSNDTYDTYRADPFSHVGNEVRRDWALFDWGDDGHVPGQIICFIEFEPPDIDKYNNTYPERLPLTESGNYAMIHSMKKPIIGLTDPNNINLDPMDIMQANSILLFYGEKELGGVDLQTPVVYLIHVSSILRPLIVIPDFSPSFEQNKHGVNVDKWITHTHAGYPGEHAFIVVRPREEWHLVYLAHSHAHYNQMLATGKEKAPPEDVEDEDDANDYEYIGDGSTPNQTQARLSEVRGSYDNTVVRQEDDDSSDEEEIELCYREPAEDDVDPYEQDLIEDDDEDVDARIPEHDEEDEDDVVSVDDD